ncbi:ribose-phosphate pyrophosphokinase [Candidatus Woesearchaeota archaeon]|nr:ribose-phosphate pyrophosphokinase [Candidatus Woesearchaeota archaeon]
MEHLKIIAGTANRSLAEEVAKNLKMKLTPAEIKRFPDGEIYVHILESVRGCDVYVIQPTSPDGNQNLMELLIMVDALKRSSPNKIIAVIPYFGYCRQDRKAKAREPITAKLVAKMIETAGVDRVITFDFHVAQIQGFFDIHSDNLDLIPHIVQHILGRKLKDIVIVAPDVGGASRARTYAKVLHAPIAIIDKRRAEGTRKVIVENIIGDIKGKTCIIIDDIIDTAGTITEAASLLKQKGAKEIYVYATHAVLSGNAIEKIKNAPIREIVFTNTIELPKGKMLPKIKVLSVGHFLAETIRRNYGGMPMGIVYDSMYKKIQETMKK